MFESIPPLSYVVFWEETKAPAKSFQLLLIIEAVYIPPTISFLLAEFG
jgi:hypothetical protein